MLDIAVLAFCSDESLAKTVRDIVATAKRCLFERLDDLDGLADRLRRGDVALIVAHLADAGQKLQSTACCT